VGSPGRNGVGHSGSSANCLAPTGMITPGSLRDTQMWIAVEISTDGSSDPALIVIVSDGLSDSEPRAAIRAEGAPEPATAVSGAAPEPRLALRQSKACAPNLQGHAEGRSGLLLAFPAMANVKRQGFARAGIPNFAALTSPDPHPQRLRHSQLSPTIVALAGREKQMGVPQHA
jgi:hypothetical protein